jgi:hypothetical protein
MKRCPKCNRTYPTDSQKFCTRDGGLLETVADSLAATGPINAPPAGQVDTGPLQPFDPYKTVFSQPEPPPPKSSPAFPQSAPATPPAPTGPIQASTPLPQTPMPQPPKAAGPQRKSSRAGLIFGSLAVVFVLGIIVVAAAYLVVIKPRLANRNTTSNSNRASRQRSPQPSPIATSSSTPAPAPTEPPFVPPANTIQFLNSKDKLDGKLAEHYVDFSFYYPSNWIKDPAAGVPGATNFAKVERRLPPDLTQENFAVGWYTSTGSDTSDRELYPKLVQKFSSQYQKSFPEYHKVSEGETKAGIYEGYEFRFQAFSRNTPNGDLKIWGRTVFLPPAEGERNGATLLMLTTSLAPELKSINDVGVKGELPIILESFRLGKK